MPEHDPEHEYTSDPVPDDIGPPGEPGPIDTAEQEPDPIDVGEDAADEAHEAVVEDN